MNRQNKLDFITFNKYSHAVIIKAKDLIHLQTPELAKHSLVLLVELTEVNDSEELSGIVLGTEGFNRGTEKTVFRKIYAGDFVSFDIAGIKTNTIITFKPENIKDIL